VKRVATQLVRMAVLVLAAGLISAFLARYSPGALVDERELDQRLSEDSLSALRAKKGEDANAGANFARYVRGLARGDLGYSRSNHAPIGELILDRAPETLRELGIGLAGGWLLGLGFAIPVGRWRRAWIYDGAASLTAGLLLCLPAALVAYLCLTAGYKSAVVLVIVLAPKIFRFTRNLVVEAYSAPHVTMARARGITESRILWGHVLRSTAPQLLALAATSASMAIGAAIPIETICDVPGLGRLAWQAATARDLPLLVNLTMLVALFTMAAAALAEAMTSTETTTRRVGARSR
jgi:peptide/nickel transport system permease protein